MSDDLQVKNLVNLKQGAIQSLQHMHAKNEDDRVQLGIFLSKVQWAISLSEQEANRVKAKEEAEMHARVQLGISLSKQEANGVNAKNAKSQGALRVLKQEPQVGNFEFQKELGQAIETRKRKAAQGVATIRPVSENIERRLAALFAGVTNVS